METPKDLFMLNIRKASNIKKSFNPYLTDAENAYLKKYNNGLCKVYVKHDCDIKLVNKILSQEEKKDIKPKKERKINKLYFVFILFLLSLSIFFY